MSVRKLFDVSCTLPHLLVLVAATQVEAASFRGLGDLPGGIFFSDAYAVSPDGSVVARYSVSGLGNEARSISLDAGQRHGGVE